MHKSAFLNAQRFNDTYLSNQNPLIVEIGSQVVDKQSSLREVFINASDYIGIDFIDAPGVDIVITDPYSLPLENQLADVIVSSSCFEHSEFFWLSFLEMCRIAKENSLLYLNVPSNGNFHRYPVDCWCFYPDSGRALQKWGRLNDYSITLLESFVSCQDDDGWNDFVAIFGIGEEAISRNPNRIISAFTDYTNGLTAECSSFLNGTSFTEDQARRTVACDIASGRLPFDWLGKIEGGSKIQ